MQRSQKDPKRGQDGDKAPEIMAIITPIAGPFRPLLHVPQDQKPTQVRHLLLPHLPQDATELHHHQENSETIVNKTILKKM